jgi:hypothetical protein
MVIRGGSTLLDFGATSPGCSRWSEDRLAAAVVLYPQLVRMADRRAHGVVVAAIDVVEATERRINVLRVERKQRGAEEAPCRSVRLWRHGIELETTTARESARSATA